MLHYPEIDPIAIQLGPLAIRWYGLMYLFGLLMAWYLAKRRASRYGWQVQQLSDLMFYGFLGVVLGGRLGFVLFYDLAQWLQDPWLVFRINQGGMSFHGGFLGVLMAVALYCRHLGKSFWATMDYIAPIVPLGLATGRLGNFINGELVGRPTELPWGMVFAHVDSLPRHPSQLYEMALEGVVLFLLLWWFSRRSRPLMATSGLFALGYGTLRFLVEFARQPDSFGFVAWGWLTQGQLLCIPMIIGGAGLLFWAYRHSTQRIG